MSDFSVCPRPELVSEENRTTAVAGCAVVDVAIIGTGIPVGIDPETGDPLCVYIPPTPWVC